MREKQTNEIADIGKKAIISALRDVKPPSRNAKIGIINNPDGFKHEIERIAVEIIKEMTRLPVYPDKVRPIKDQIEEISAIFDLDPTEALRTIEILPQLPKGADDWFAVPRVGGIINKHFPEITDNVRQYRKVIELTLGKLREDRSFHYHFYNFEEFSNNVYRFPKDIEPLQKLEYQQNESDILIIAAQQGLKHYGRTVEYARKRFSANEFGLGFFFQMCMALVHPYHYVCSCSSEIYLKEILCSGDIYHDNDGNKEGIGLRVDCEDDYGLEYSGPKWLLSLVLTSRPYYKCKSGIMSAFLPG